jgi:hypothetical protein
LFFSFLITIGFNVDTISLASFLYSHPDERAKWANSAYSSVEDNKFKELIAKVPQSQKPISPADSLLFEINKQHDNIKLAAGALSAELPIGWTKAERDSYSTNWPKKIGGWLITMFAVCLGGPFWFDVLGKLANIRSVIKPKQDS